MAYTKTNKRILPLRLAEARKLIFYGHAEWRGRKEGEAVTVFLPVRVILAFVGQQRMQKECFPCGIDSRTHKDMGGAKGYRHVRNPVYSLAARHITDHQFLSDYPYCDLALMVYKRDLGEARL